MTEASKEEKANRPVSAMKQGLALIGRATITVAVIALSGTLVWFGSSELGRLANAAPSPEPAPVTPVTAAPLNLQSGYTINRAFIGQVEPQKTVAISFELPGRLSEILVDEGERVEAGDILAWQDTSLLVAERTRLEAAKTATLAQLRFADQTVRRREKLAERGFAAQSGLDEALARRNELRARIGEIDASLATIEIRMQKSVIRAPFEGRITKRLVDGAETLGAGQQVLELVDSRKAHLRIGVPLNVSESSLSQASVDVNGLIHEARMVALRPDIDPVTRTRTAVFELATDAQPLFGQTARLILQERIEEAGLWLSTTVLQEGQRGQWTIFTVDQGRTVRPLVVEVLHAESDRVFVRGAFPSGTMLITEGAQRVTIGQQVAVLNDQ